MTDSTLTFVDYDQNGKVTSAWSPTDAGKWEDDVRRGEMYANELASNLCRHGDSALAVQVIRSAATRKDAVSTGFLFRIAELVKPTMSAVLTCIVFWE